jgi:hypothetical protein
MGTLSPCPWDLSLSRQNGWLLGGGWRRPAIPAPGVDARVASLRCPILRPGEVSINRAARRRDPNRKNFLPELPPVRYNNLCPRCGPVAGFEVITGGRF